MPETDNKSLPSAEQAWAEGSCPRPWVPEQRQAAPHSKHLKKQTEAKPTPRPTRPTTQTAPWIWLPTSKAEVSVTSVMKCDICGVHLKNCILRHQWSMEKRVNETPSLPPECSEIIRDNRCIQDSEMCIIMKNFSKLSNSHEHPLELIIPGMQEVIDSWERRILSPLDQSPSIQITRTASLLPDCLFHFLLMLRISFRGYKACLSAIRENRFKIEVLWDG